MKKLKSLENLEESLAKLPSIGKKTAERMAYAMLNFSDDDLTQIAEAIKNLNKHISCCPICGMIIENNYCEICNDRDRDDSMIMVVSYPKDVISMERSGVFKGKYHVLNGEICLAKGLHVEDLNIPSLLERLNDGKVKEIVLATNPNLDGETTALYLAKKLQPYNVNVTRLAYGLQMGANLDYVDPLTLGKALEGRKKI